MTTKILAMVDALGDLVDFRLLLGEYNDICGMKSLLRGVRDEA